jgi:hypothetical protein
VFFTSHVLTVFFIIIPFSSLNFYDGPRQSFNHRGDLTLMISYRDLIGRVRCFFIVQWIMGPGQTILLIRFTCWLLLGDTIYHRPHANPWRGGGNFISKGARLLFGQRAFQFQTEATFIFPIFLGRLANAFGHTIDPSSDLRFNCTNKSFSYTHVR